MTGIEQFRLIIGSSLTSNWWCSGALKQLFECNLDVRKYHSL